MAMSRTVAHADLSVKILVHQVRLGAERYRVISPAAPLRNGALYRSPFTYDLRLDRETGRRIGALWLLAARSPRSLVHLPLRAAAAASGFGNEYGDGEPLDLVLAHRAVQFRPSRWKEIRARKAAGNAPRERRTARLPLGDLPSGTPEVAYGVPSPTARHTPPHQRLHAGTLFLTGTTAGFRQAAAQLFAVAGDGPSAAVTGGAYDYPGCCGHHLCRGLYYWPELAGRPDHQDIHVVYTPPEK
ncbi:hypothetical protein ACFXG1_19625 [Streptomyces sp. NPDC059248]|uniref:hypothetical protein n=1 Tax=Streptomyces sp. NPDC059248 TaxID=3346791 RepID=UPI003698E481